MATLRRCLETTPAILLRKTRLTETSLIVTWFTEQHGKIKTVAKGARQPKSRFAGLLDLFYDCEVQFARSRKSELHMLREVALRNPHDGLRRSYERVALASYFAELVEHVTESDHAVPEIYSLLQRALGYVAGKGADRRALLHFEAELVRMLGIQGQAGVTPIVAIGRAYQWVPSSRPALLRQLPAAGASGPPENRDEA